LVLITSLVVVLELIFGCSTPHLVETAVLVALATASAALHAVVVGPLSWDALVENVGAELVNQRQN
jgi:purine-cytosine permease-like protein